METSRLHSQLPYDSVRISNGLSFRLIVLNLQIGKWINMNSPSEIIFSNCEFWLPRACSKIAPRRSELFVFVFDDDINTENFLNFLKNVGLKWHKIDNNLMCHAKSICNSYLEGSIVRLSIRTSWFCVFTCNCWHIIT